VKEPLPRPRRRDAALIVSLLLVAATIWFTVLGPLGGTAGWNTLLAIAILLAAGRFAGPLVRRLSRKVQGKGKRGRHQE